VSAPRTFKKSLQLAVASSVVIAIFSPLPTMALAKRSPAAADSTPAAIAAAHGAARAPSQPPLSTVGGSTPESAGEVSTPGVPQVEADPLVSNGLGSPSCRSAIGTGVLSPARARNCSTSGFSAAAAPTGNYGLDVHIDTGFLGLSSGGLLSVVQNLFVAPVWMALVWCVHALVVMLEWCFAIDLLDSPVSGDVGRGLREMQASFTEPWLAAALAVAAVLAIYNGVIRRRVSDTLGQALAMAAMMAGGMWLIADPTGTVGAVGAWANQASLGTLAVTARGAGSRPARALPDSMAALFSSAIEVPWCYLEFGDVGWCRNRSRLDPKLHRAALRIASSELALIGCRSTGGLLPICVPGGSAQAVALERDASLLRAADTNGAVFLALPANGPARNSINDRGSLLRAICGSAEATRCTGPAAAQAQFRTNSGTWPRVGGLVMIVAGLLGMLLLFGFVGLRLLGAAIFSLLYLLLAPAAILAPAFGEAGRAVFRRWAAQLLAALVSKLLFSFLLGVILGVLSILAGLEGLGWWTQWLLMSAFWWGAYARRHQALAVAEGAWSPDRGRGHRTGWHPAGQRGAVRRIAGGPVSRTLDTAGSARRLAGGARGQLSAVRAQLSARRARDPASDATATPATEEQAMRLIDTERRDAQRRLEEEGRRETRLAAKRTQLERLQAEQRRAAVAGNARRAAELAGRSARLENEIGTEQRQLVDARRLSGGRSGRRSDRAVEPEQARELNAFLDAQAELPGSLRPRGTRGEGRDYARLAPLIGIGRARYEGLGPGPQREARLAIDRELTLRGQLKKTAGQQLGLTGHQRADDKAPGADAGPDLAAHIGARHRPGEVTSGADATRESSVMRDAREVAARRKRQLGLNRP
jgi:hypothetical protein